MKKNISKKAIATGAALTTLGVGAVLGQDTTRIEMYEPIPIIKIGEAHNFGGRSDSFYEMNSIDKILKDYDEGKIRPDTAIGDIEIDYFREMAIPGFAEYKMTPKDRIAANIIASCLNNTNNGQQKGELTSQETFTIYKALRNAGYLRNKGDRVKVLFPLNNAGGFGTIDGKKALFPAENLVRAAIFVYDGKDKPCTNCDEDQELNSANGRTSRIDKDTIAKTFNWEPELSVVYTTADKDINWMPPSVLDTKNINWMPQLGLSCHYGRLGFGITGAYSNFNAQDSIVFLNAQGNGKTVDKNTLNKNLTSLGAKLFYDITDRLSLGVVGEMHYFNQTEGGSVRTVVNDPVNGLDITVDKNTIKHNTHYSTLGPEARYRFGKRLGAFAGAQFRGKQFNCAYGGLSYSIGR